MLELKDPNYRIATKKIEATNENYKEFDMHICCKFKCTTKVSRTVKLFTCKTQFTTN